MKSLIKKIIPRFIWETARQTYVYIRRLFLDFFYTALPTHPVEWIKMLFLVRTVRPEYSMVPTVRLRVLYELSKKINEKDIPGDIIECGVYNGGSAAIMMHPQFLSGKNRNIWLFDSFEGLPPPTENDGSYEKENYFKGWCKGSIEKVEEIFGKLGLPSKHLHIIKGWFQNTFSVENFKIEKIALLHIDSDWYESVKICIENFYPKVSKGGYICFDDYKKFLGCKRAVQEYLQSNNIKVELKMYDNGMYFRKP
jgi:O-methyltransferase